MVPNRSRSAIAVAMALAGALVLVACQPLPGPGSTAYSCTTDIGELPKFAVLGSPFVVRRPAIGSGQAVVVEVRVEVEAGSFDYVLWDVLGAEGYDQPPQILTYFVQVNPTLGRTSTLVEFMFYEDSPAADYELRIRGLAFEGTFFDDIEDPAVGECFHAFELWVM